jgi:hypothetical protein
MSSPSASPALSCGKRKRKSVSTPRTPVAIVPAGTDLTIIVKPKESGGIVMHVDEAVNYRPELFWQNRFVVRHDGQ